MYTVAYISKKLLGKLQHLVSCMPWPMTLAPTNEAIRRENHAKKNLGIGKEFTVMIREVM
jgi:hypothetical protein